MPNSPSSSNCSRSSDFVFQVQGSKFQVEIGSTWNFELATAPGDPTLAYSLLGGIAMNPVALEIRRLPVAELNPAPYNPRRALKPTDPAYRKLEASLRQFGLVEPLVWNESTGHVVGGHARLRILKELGVAEVPVSVVRLNSER